VVDTVNVQSNTQLAKGELLVKINPQENLKVSPKTGLSQPCPHLPTLGMAAVTRSLQVSGVSFAINHLHLCEIYQCPFLTDRTLHDTLAHAGTECTNYFPGNTQQKRSSPYNEFVASGKWLRVLMGMPD
jgi:hypothetical protein